MQFDQYECVPKHWMTEERFGRDWLEYIWHNIYLDCQPDPGIKLANVDVNEDDDGSIVPEEEEEDDKDLTEDEKLKKERESSGLRIHKCLLQVMMKTICQLITVLIKTMIMVEMLSCGIKKQRYSSIKGTNLVERIANILDFL